MRQAQPGKERKNSMKAVKQVHHVALQVGTLGFAGCSKCVVLAAKNMILLGLFIPGYRSGSLDDSCVKPGCYAKAELFALIDKFFLKVTPADERLLNNLPAKPGQN